jgi:hypothetical protein
METPTILPQNESNSEFCLNQPDLAAHQSSKGCRTFKGNPVVGAVMLSNFGDLPQNSRYINKADKLFLEQVNIRWIPLFIDDSDSETEIKMSKINGIYLTGGLEPFYEE